MYNMKCKKQFRLYQKSNQPAVPFKTQRWSGVHKGGLSIHTVAARRGSKIAVGQEYLG
jgi:hypothetical protein